MDYEMETAESSTSKEVMDKSIDVEWQIDSEWINLSASTPAGSAHNKRGKQQAKHEFTDSSTESPPSFHFIPASKGGRFLVMDNQTLRLSQKKQSGYSYWVCSIPCCTARCLLDPEEKNLVRFCKDHNHEGDISRKEYKKFINALKTAVKENPHVKPKALYDAELAKTVESWRANKAKTNSNEEEPCLPTFEAVRTAMYNSRNAVLSAVSLKAASDEPATVETESSQHAGPSRSTRSRDAKANPKRKSIPSKAVMQSSSDLDELEEEWSSEPHKDANLSDYEEWLEEDVNANLTMISVTPQKQLPSPKQLVSARQLVSPKQVTPPQQLVSPKQQMKVSPSPPKKTPVKGMQEMNLSLTDNDENSLWDGIAPLESIPRRKYRKRPASSSVFTCPHCPYKSNRHFNVQRHERLAHSTKKPEFSCKECGTSYSLEYRLKLHIKAVHQGEGHHCHICSRTFETMTGLKSHIVTKHKNEDPKVQRDPPPELTCKLCGRVFSTKSHLQKHTNTHVMIQPYRCYVCNEAFMEEVTWLAHQNNCNDDFKVQCCLCSTGLDTAEQLMTHMDIAHGRAEYSCPCGKIFPWKKSLLTHQQKCSFFLAERNA